ncbi:hypothetical protein LCGC14_3064850 [marine sediment metagenome]|uniref:Uncharacterized protein n=1 Tax=marine sediment metagenome TaxID=412755 RepID=A0A0F8WHU5_9ZZZZ
MDRKNVGFRIIYKKGGEFCVEWWTTHESALRHADMLRKQGAVDSLPTSIPITKGDDDE